MRFIQHAVLLITWIFCKVKLQTPLVFCCCFSLTVYCENAWTEKSKEDCDEHPDIFRPDSLLAFCRVCFFFYSITDHLSSVSISFFFFFHGSILNKWRLLDISSQNSSEYKNKDSLQLKQAPTSHLRLNSSSITSFNIQSIFRFPQSSSKCLSLLLFVLIQDPIRDHTLHLICHMPVSSPRN